MSKRNRGGRRLRVALATAIAALGVSAVGASSASAVQTVEFDHGFLKVALPAPFEIVTPDEPVQLANFPDAGGDYNIEEVDVTFPEFSGEALPGVPVTVNLAPTQNLTGDYNTATGAFTGDSSNWQAVLSVAGDPCTIGPFPMALSTATNAVFQGDPFDAGNTPQNGAISHAWTALPAGVGDGCALVGPLTATAGGIWLSDNVATPTFVPEPDEPPVDEPDPPAKKKKCKKKGKGKKAGAAKKKKCKKKKKK